MNAKSLRVAVACVIASAASSAHAGSFWFPVEGHYPYSTNLLVTAVPDLDSTVGTIKTRLFEEGNKTDGCLSDSPGYPCSSPFSPANSVWAYKKDGSGDWAFDGVRYNDGQGGSGKKWLWYDNHNGYDFVSTTTVNPRIFSVEVGTTCGHVSAYGQICIEHNLNGVLYRTWYTHMSNIPSNLKTNGGHGHSVYRWYYLGRMSNVGTSGTHLHFVTKKKVGSAWVVVDPYGHKPGWPSDTSDDPSNPYLWE